MHFWSVWHEGKPFEEYLTVKPRFCSEFGYQSFPSLSTIRSYAKPEECNVTSPVMEHHQRNPGGNSRITENMTRYFRFPEGFANFVYLSQVQQGLAIRMAIEHFRRARPHMHGRALLAAQRHVAGGVVGVAGVWRKMEGASLHGEKVLRADFDFGRADEGRDD